MKKYLFEKLKKRVLSSNLPDIVEVKVFQNKTNKQFNLPVLKKSTSKNIMKEIFGNKDVIGLKFKITDVILRKNYKGGKK